MVLTNFELWAADGTSGSSLSLDNGPNNLLARHLNPFDPRVVPQLNTNINHLSSNGYYGFAYVNAARDLEMNNNINNNISNINNNNNNTTCNLMANDVNGITNNTSSATNMQQSHEASVNFDSSAYVAGHINVARCKKRFLVINDDDSATNNKNYDSNNYEVSAKRCRFDDDFSAQYCNDFFQLPSTQIGTQSCLMDTEEEQQPLQRQQQTDETMIENTNNNLEKIEQNINLQLQTFSADNQHRRQQELKSPQQQQQEAQQTQLYHQQQHYQGIQFATIKCHLNNNNNCNTLPSNTHTCKIGLEKNCENLLRTYNPNSIQIENNDDNDVANESNVDDATLFAHLHGGCLHHHVYFNTNISLSQRNYFAAKDAINNNAQDDDGNEEF